MLVSLERLSYTMVFVSWQQHVLRKINLHAMSLPNCDRGRDLNEPVENRGGRLRHAGRRTVRKRLRAGTGEIRPALADLRGTSDHTKRNRRSEDLQVVIVDLILQALLADLIEAVELVEVNAVSVRHQQAMESDRDSPLLAETGGADLAGLAQHDRSLGNEDVLVIVRVHRIRYQHLHRPHGIAVKPIHQHRIERQAFIDDIGLAYGIVDIGLARTFVLRRRYLISRRLLLSGDAGSGQGSRLARL